MYYWRWQLECPPGYASLATAETFFDTQWRRREAYYLTIEQAVENRFVQCSYHLIFNIQFEFVIPLPIIDQLHKVVLEKKAYHQTCLSLWREAGIA